MLLFLVDLHLDVLAKKRIFLDKLMGKSIVLLVNHCFQMLDLKSFHHQLSLQLVLFKRSIFQLAYPKTLSFLHLLDEPAILFSFLRQLLL